MHDSSPSSISSISTSSDDNLPKDSELQHDVSKCGWAWWECLNARPKSGGLVAVSTFRQGCCPFPRRILRKRTHWGGMGSGGSLSHLRWEGKQLSGLSPGELAFSPQTKQIIRWLKRLTTRSPLPCRIFSVQNTVRCLADDGADSRQ